MKKLLLTITFTFTSTIALAANDGKECIQKIAYFSGIQNSYPVYKEFGGTPNCNFVLWAHSGLLRIKMLEGRYVNASTTIYEDDADAERIIEECSINGNKLVLKVSEAFYPDEYYYEVEMEKDDENVLKNARVLEERYGNMLQAGFRHERSCSFH